MPPPPEPTPAELCALADKYQRLAQLRTVRDGEQPPTTRAVLRQLSQQYPGALRELDTLGYEELGRRALAARAAAAGGGPIEPWMAYILAFHRLMAAALFVKRTQVGPVDEAQTSAIAGVALAPDLVERLRRPPGGRVTPLVIAEVARWFGRPAREIAELLFPIRRASPYDLG